MDLRPRTLWGRRFRAEDLEIVFRTLSWEAYCIGSIGILEREFPLIPNTSPTPGPMLRTLHKRPREKVVLYTVAAAPWCPMR